jgi:RsiW-degrading membrane proteinase PrsW (M82 family)
VLLAHALPSGGGTLDWIGGVGAVFAGVFAWFVYFQLKDRAKPEPLVALLVAFVFGIGSAGLALLAYRALPSLGLPDGPGRTVGETFTFCVALVGPIEEGCKYLVARATVFRFRAFDEEIDGLVYASAVALGFASLENVLYLPLLDWPTRVARTLATPLSHSLFSAVWGFGVAWSRFHARGRAARVGAEVGTLALAMLLHGLYDYVLLAHGATLAAGGLVLAVWIFVIVKARDAVRAAPQAPTQGH